MGTPLFGLFLQKIAGEIPRAVGGSTALRDDAFDGMRRIGAGKEP